MEVVRGADATTLPSPRMLEDLYILRDRAKAALTRGDLDTALSALLSAAGQTHVSEHDYTAILRPLEDTLARRGNPRGALTVVCYLAATDQAAWKRARALAHAARSARSIARASWPRRGRWRTPHARWRTPGWSPPRPSAASGQRTGAQRARCGHAWRT